MAVAKHFEKINDLKKTIAKDQLKMKNIFSKAGKKNHQNLA